MAQRDGSEETQHQFNTSESESHLLPIERKNLENERVIKLADVAAASEERQDQIKLAEIAAAAEERQNQIKLAEIAAAAAAEERQDQIKLAEIAAAAAEEERRDQIKLAEIAAAAEKRRLTAAEDERQHRIRLEELELESLRVRGSQSAQTPVAASSAGAAAPTPHGRTLPYTSRSLNSHKLAFRNVHGNPDCDGKTG